jgi:hypothetical protein
LFAEKSSEDFPDNYFTGKNERQTGKRCAQRHKMRKECNGDELRRGMAVSGCIGSASVWMRVSDKLPVNNMRMYKTSGIYHVAAKEYK